KFPEGNFDEVFFPSLHMAAKTGNINQMGERVEEGEDVNSLDDQGLTPAAYAAGMGHVPALAALCVLGADVRFRDSQNNSLFHLAAAYDQVDVVKYLVLFGEKHPEFGEEFKQNVWASWKNDMGNSVLDIAQRGSQGQVYLYLCERLKLRVAARAVN
ncbi:ANKRD52, partial [Symbiodinium pilosum]